MSFQSNILNVMKINQICRICLEENDDMESIFSKMDLNDCVDVNSYSVSDVLLRITTIPVAQGDGLPNLICRYCLVLLEGAYKFKLLFEHSNSVLQNYISNLIKLEEEEPVGSPDVIVNDDYDSNAGDKYVESLVNTQSKRQTRSSQKPVIKRPKRRKVLSVEDDTKEINNEMSDEDSEEKYSPLKHPCPICTKDFTALELREHAHTHKALKKYLKIPSRCKVPKVTKFYATPALNEENISIHYRKDKRHNCVMCDFVGNARELRLHLDKHRNQKEFKCNQCERVFKKLNHLNTHKVKHLKEYPYKCEKCGKGFVIKTNYDCHMLTHDTNAELPHECSHCFKRFSNPEHLNRHMLIHTENVSYSVKYKVCKCHHCLKTFRDRAELQSHTCVPLEQAVNTKYPCKDCHKVFKNSSGLYNHVRNIHKLKGAKVLCSVCGSYVANIYNHMMRHNGDKPYQCSQCGKKFIGKPQLRQHLLVHSGLKPFVCSTCAKPFNNLYNLQVHERIHKGDRCHICAVCGKGFLEKSYLKKHLNVHNKM